MTRLSLVLLLLVSACFKTGPVGLRPGSDMALPRRAPLSVGARGGHTCAEGSIGAVKVVGGDAQHCSTLRPDTLPRRPSPPTHVVP